MLTICIDFDGVIHSYTSGWKGIDVVSDPPNTGSFAALTEYVKHFDVCIYSSRSKDKHGVESMKRWFAEYGWPQDGEGNLIGLRFPVEKPAAFITIDDRCICFDGKFPGTEEIKTFKPWNKKLLTTTTKAQSNDRSLK